MNIEIMSEEKTFFEHFPSWKIDGLLLNAKKDKRERAIYRPCVRKGKVISAKVFANDSPGGVFEATTHEIAHLIDLAIRGQTARFLKHDYGYSFDNPAIGSAAPSKMIQGLKNELHVFAIEAKLFRMAGWSWDEIEAAVRILKDGLIIIDYLTAALDIYEQKFGTEAKNDLIRPWNIIQKAKKIKAPTLEKEWDKVKAMFA